MTDYRTLLRHAGLPDEEVERIAAQAEADDRSRTNEDEESENYEIKEKHIKMICRQTGLDLADSHSIMIDGSTGEVAISDGGHGISVAQLLDFSNKIASAQIGHDVKVSGNDAILRLSFTLI